jgi:ubiquinone/menaquinone biosynthesis C-methylase UbiE
MRDLWWRLVRFGFRLLYHEMAFTYDTVANVVSLGQWWDWQRAALDFLPPSDAGPILELAYGTGRFHKELIAKGYQVTGLDFSRQMARITRHRLRRERAPICIVRGMAQNLPLPGGTFTAVVSTFPTPFIIEDKTLAEVHRVLLSDGRLVFVPNGVLTRGGPVKSALEGAYQVTGQRGPWGVDIGERFAKNGFALETHQIALPRSVVTVIVAQKASSN